MALKDKNSKPAKRAVMPGKKLSDMTTKKRPGGIKISKAEKERFAKIAGQTASANYKKKVGGLIGPDARANIEVAAEKRTMKTFDSKKSTAAKPKITAADKAKAAQKIKTMQPAKPKITMTAKTQPKPTTKSDKTKATMMSKAKPATSKKAK